MAILLSYTSKHQQGIHQVWRGKIIIESLFPQTTLRADQSYRMVIGLYLHSKTNRHSAEAAPHWRHPLTCDHGVGGRMQCSTCTWVCCGACWPVFALISWRTLPLCYQIADFVDWNSRQTAIHFSILWLHCFPFTHTLFFRSCVQCFKAYLSRILWFR